MPSIPGSSAPGSSTGAGGVDGTGTGAPTLDPDGTAPQTPGDPLPDGSGAGDGAPDPDAPIAIPAPGAPDPADDLPGVVTVESEPAPAADVAAKNQTVVQQLDNAPDKPSNSTGVPIQPIDDVAPAPTAADSKPLPPPPVVPRAVDVPAPARSEASAPAPASAPAQPSTPSVQSRVDTSQRTAQEQAADRTGTSTAGVERVAPHVTLPSQPIAGPIAPPPSAVLTGSPGMLPHQQVAAAFGGLLRGPDGSYQVQLNLLPAHLGAVNISVELRGGEVSIHLHAIDTGARDLLRDNLQNLRQDLINMGLKANQLDVGSGRDDAARQWNQHQGLNGGSGSGGDSRGSGSDGRDSSGYERGDDVYLGDESGAGSTTRGQLGGDSLDVRV